jgi:hypothetical protein
LDFDARSKLTLDVGVGMPCLFHVEVSVKSGRFVNEMTPRPSIVHEPILGRGTLIKSSRILEMLR